MLTVQLIGIGEHSAILAADLQVGDETVWNYGCTTRVVGVVRETPAFITYQLDGGNGVHERRLKKNRLVAVSRAL